MLFALGWKEAHPDPSVRTSLKNTAGFHAVLQPSKKKKIRWKNESVSSPSLKVKHHSTKLKYNRWLSAFPSTRHSSAEKRTCLETVYFSRRPFFHSLYHQAHGCDQTHQQNVVSMLAFTYIRPSIVQSGNIAETWGWLSGGPTLSCFGPVYQPQCVPPTFISSSSPLYSSSATQISPCTSPTRAHLDIRAARRTPISYSLPTLTMPLPLGAEPLSRMDARLCGRLLSG